MAQPLASLSSCRWRVAAWHQRTGGKAIHFHAVVRNGTTGRLPRLPALFAKIVQLLILTGQRRGEIAALQTSWINENSVTIPPTTTKNRREHTFSDWDTFVWHFGFPLPLPSILHPAISSPPMGVANGQRAFTG
jgi:hypothetical protein